MTRRFAFAATVALTALLGNSRITQAAIILDVDRTTFNANVALGSYTETFTGNVGTSATASFAGGTPTFGYSLAVLNSLVPASAIFRNGTTIGNLAGNENLIITPTTGNISAFGADFFLTNFFDVFQGVPVSITVIDSLGDVVTSRFTPTSQTVGSFRGFRSTGIITSVTLAAPGVDLVNRLDNVTVGSLSPNVAVPEPSSLALCGIASLVGLGGWMRRWRQAV